jgi:hypothetical protein
VTETSEVERSASSPHDDGAEQRLGNVGHHEPSDRRQGISRSEVHQGLGEGYGPEYDGPLPDRQAYEEGNGDPGGYEERRGKTGLA